MTFNLYLKLVREHCKMTKEEFAQKLEISVVTLTFLEYGEPLWCVGTGRGFARAGPNAGPCGGLCDAGAHRCNAGRYARHGAFWPAP